MGTFDALPAPAIQAVPDYDTQFVVEVRNRFDGSWSHGFEIIETPEVDGPARYRLRRLSDGVVLPELFGAQDIIVRAVTPPMSGR
ncbi:MAG TPA: hypothetical protein VHD87_07510 [Acidimicrobiales bacterium]|nr:hypothetical protein [Acidimicrobiales bacterium]